MPPSEFVLISKAFSDGLSLQKDGPLVTKEYSSKCILEGGNSFVTAASFVSKLVPKHFVTTLKVDDELTYFESVSFERRTVMQNFSETINVFSKDTVNTFCSNLFYEPNTTKKIYIAGIELLPAQKCCVVIGEGGLNHDSDATQCGEKSGAMNGDISGCQLINGEV